MFGRIGMSMCPGREWNSWSRDFEADVKIVVENKVNVVASIITHSELKQMNQYDFYDKIRKFGLESLEYSIHDKWVPNSVENFMKIVDKIVEYIRQEKTVLVHCNGGRGRTGLIVAASIILIGYSSDQAIQMVRTARTGMLRNPAQEVFLHALQNKIQSQTPASPITPTISLEPTLSTSKKTKILPLLRKQSVTPKKRDFFHNRADNQTLTRSKTINNSQADYPMTSPVHRNGTRREKRGEIRSPSAMNRSHLLPETRPLNGDLELFEVIERAGSAPFELSAPLLQSGRRKVSDEN